MGEWQYVDDTLAEIRDELRGLRSGGEYETKQPSEYEEWRRNGGELLAERKGSRYLGPGASKSLAEHVAQGGTVETADRPAGLGGYGMKSASLSRSMKALAAGTTSSGGAVTIPQLAAELTPLLRARTAVLALGANVESVQTELDIAGLSSGATAYFVAENSMIPTSEQTFDFAAILKPKALAALIPVSLRLLKDAAVNPSLETALRTDLSQVLALRADLAFLRGTGNGGEPKGLLNYDGLTPTADLGADGEVLNFDMLHDVVGGLREINAPFSSPGWIFNAKMLTSLSKLKTSAGVYLTSDPNLLQFDRTGGGGSLLGFPFRTTSQIPANLGTSGDQSEIYFSSDWNEFWVGMDGNLVIEVSNDASYSPDGGTSWVNAFQNMQQLFRAVMWVDGAPRRPQLFSILSGVRPLASGGS